MRDISLANAATLVLADNNVRGLTALSDSRIDGGAVVSERNVFSADESDAATDAVAFALRNTSLNGTAVDFRDSIFTAVHRSPSGKAVDLQLDPHTRFAGNAQLTLTTTR
jgi:hypothetical protein